MENFRMSRHSFSLQLGFLWQFYGTILTCLLVEGKQISLSASYWICWCIFKVNLCTVVDQVITIWAFDPTKRHRIALDNIVINKFVSFRNQINIEIVECAQIMNVVVITLLHSTQPLVSRSETTFCLLFVSLLVDDNERAIASLVQNRWIYHLWPDFGKPNLSCKMLFRIIHHFMLVTRILSILSFVGNHKKQSLSFLLVHIRSLYEL